MKTPSFWGFKRTYGESASAFFESIRSEVVDETQSKNLSMVEYEDEEFVVTKYSPVDSNKSSSSSQS